MTLPPVLQRFLSPAFLRYLLVGGFGFVLDAGGMEVLYRLGLDVHAARGLSMTGAIGCTYLFHRHYTFTDSKRPARTSAQFMAFGAVQLAAAALNYGIFCAVLWLQPKIMPAPLPGLWQDLFNLFAVGFGVGAGLIFNFALLRLLVFQAAAPHEQRAPESETPLDRRARLRRQAWQAAIWVLFALQLLLPAHARQLQVMSFPELKAPLAPADPDVWVRLTSVRQWLTGGGFFNHAIRNTNAPFGGITTPWTRPLDMLLALVYFCTPVLLKTNVRLMLSATWLPRILCLIAAGLSAAAARRIFRHNHVLAGAAILWLSNPDVYDYFAPGDSDHHGLLCMLWCGVLLLLTGPVVSAVAATVIGVVLGVMIWISPEALAVAAAVFALMGGEALFRPEKMRLLAFAAAGAALSATLGLYIEMPAAEALTRLTYDTLSIVQVSLLWLTAAGTMALAALFQNRLSFAARFFAAAVAGGAVLLGMHFLYPRFFLGPMADADPFIFTDFLPHVEEATPLFREGVVDILRMAVGPLLAALLLVAAFTSGRLRDARRRQLILLALLLAGTFIWTMFQIRWDYYLQPVAIVAAAALLPSTLALARLRLKGLLAAPPRGWLPYFVLWAMFVGISVAVRMHPARASPVAACQQQIRYAIETRQLQPLLGDSGLIVYAPADVGGDILFFTPYRIIASNYHREGKGLKDLKRLETASTEKAALAVLKEREVDALLYCPARLGPKSWLREIADARKYPRGIMPVAGLRFMETPGPLPVLLKVKK